MNLHSNIQIETEDLWHVEFQPMITHSAAMVRSWLSSLGGCVWLPGGIWHIVRL